MVTLINPEARDIIGVDYAVTWASVSEMLNLMQSPRVGPSRSLVNAELVKEFRGHVRDVTKGDQCRELAKRLASKVPSFVKDAKRLTRVWSDDDGDLSIDRYLNDEEACWRRMRRPRRAAKTIRLMAEISATGQTTDIGLLTRTATIIAISDWLVAEGYEVEILAADYSREFLAYTGGTELGTVVVKQAHDQLDVDNLAAVLGSQNFGYHILLKAVVHACPLKVEHHWGEVIPIPQNVISNLGVDVSVPRSVMNPEAAIAWLESTASALERRPPT